MHSIAYSVRRKGNPFEYNRRLEPLIVIIAKVISVGKIFKDIFIESSNQYTFFNRCRRNFHARLYKFNH